MKLKQTLTAGVISFAVIFGAAGCAPAEPTPAPNASQTAEDTEATEEIDLEAKKQEVATAFENFLNGAYSLDTTEVNAVFTEVGYPIDSTTMPTEQQIYALMDGLEAKFPEVFGGLYTEDYSLDEIGVMYGLIYGIAQEASGKGITVEVPVEAVTSITDDATIAKVDMSKVVVSIDGQPTAGVTQEEPITYIYKSGKWLVQPDAALLGSDIEENEQTGVEADSDSTEE